MLEVGASDANPSAARDSEPAYVACGSGSVIWFLRMQLGLPPRAEDIQALQRALPEFFMRRTRPPHNHWLWDEINCWIASAEIPERSLYDVLTRSPRSPEQCPLPDCPLRRPSADKSDRTEEGPPSGADSQLGRLFYMSLGGGHKPPLDIFLQVAKRVHSGKGPVRRLIVTDGYLFRGRTARDKPSPTTAHFLRYLKVLDLQRVPDLQILVPPDARDPGQKWKDEVAAGAQKDLGVKVSFDNYKARGHFHDRFYLALHSGGGMSGLFGPSLTGLSDTDFVLIGALENKILDNLKRHLQL
jgi:hypothetical protein